MTQRYVTAIRMMDELLVVNATCRALNINTPSKNWDTSLVNHSWDKLYTYLHTNFPEPDPSDKATLAVIMGGMDNDEIAQYVREIPSRIPEQLFPCAMAKYLMRPCKILMEPSLTATFGEFYRRYGELLRT